MAVTAVAVAGRGGKLRRGSLVFCFRIFGACAAIENIFWFRIFVVRVQR